ncbi:hypothetical protein RB601_000979 [Gaeumannomyces tritici]
MTDGGHSLGSRQMTNWCVSVRVLLVYTLPRPPIPHPQRTATNTCLSISWTFIHSLNSPTDKMSQVTPFKVDIPESELELLRKKLELARLPDYPADTAWGEEAEGGVTAGLMRDTVQHWKTSYDWRAHEARLNEMPQYTTQVEIAGFDPLTVHFVHARAAPSARAGGAIPLLFLHGWPGSFMEVQPMLPTLLEAGFDVVAPSLPGYGFSSYPRQAGFNVAHHATAFDAVMGRLGYGQYVVQGGDWGSLVARALTLSYPSRVKALHLNMFASRKAFGPTSPEEEKELTETERAALARTSWFFPNQAAYQNVHKTKPRTLGYALHDTPVGMLSWMMDKLLFWSDKRGKTWTADEFITWTLLHYLPGPTTGMLMYRENMDPSVQAAASAYIERPTGVSHFPEEIIMAPRRWAEEECNIVFWRTHDVGGHFAAYEQPAALGKDIIDFFSAEWAK